MTISIPEIPYDWTPLWVWAVVLIVLGVCIAIGALILKFKGNGLMLGLSVVAALFWAIAVGTGIVSGIQAAHDDAVGRAQIDALGKLGYDNIDLDDSNVFTASKDGRYVKGSLIEIAPDRKYQVTELAK